MCSSAMETYFVQVYYYYRLLYLNIYTTTTVLIPECYD